MTSESATIIFGRLGADPKLAYTKKLEPVCEMSVSIANPQNETIWRKVVVFGRLAEMCSVHLKKGNLVFVRGQNVLKNFVNREGIEKNFFEFKAFNVGASLL